MRRSWLMAVVASGLWCAAAMTSTCQGQEAPCWGGRRERPFVPDATGQPSPSTYVTTQGSVHLHQPKHPHPPCQRPTSICIKPKMWRFSQVFYQLHHEVWHGVTDPCWMMDPDCCGTSCAHQKSFGLLDLFPWVKPEDSRWHDRTSPCQQCGAVDYQQPAATGCEECHGGESREFEGEGEEISPTPADPPVEHPQAAQRGPLRSVLLRRE